MCPLGQSGESLGMADNGEQVLFDGHGVKVTQYRFIVDNTVYAMQNITSIKHDVTKPPDNYYKNAALAGVVVLFGGVVALNSDHLGLFWVLLIAGLATLAYAYLVKNHNEGLPEIIRHSPPLATHKVILTSASQEQEALVTTDEALSKDVLDALNRAMSIRR